MNPNLYLDPQKEETTYLLKALSDVQKKPAKPATSDSGQKNKGCFGNPATPVEIVEEMKADKIKGLSIKKIAQKYGYSAQTVVKYTRGLKPEKVVAKEKIVVRTPFNAKNMKPVFREDTKIHEYFIHFLEHQRSELTQETYYFDLKKTFEWFFKSIRRGRSS